MRVLHSCMVLAVTAAAMLWMQQARADVVISSTRVIYPAGEREVGITLRNLGSRPALVQSWLDTGDPEAAPESIAVPFNLGPPRVRVDPQGQQVLRLMHSAEAMPQDRETLYWINVLEVPGRAVEDRSDAVEVALRTRIKLFYRPKGLDAEGAAAAADRLAWSVVRGTDGAPVLKAVNASPYHVSFLQLQLQVGDRTYTRSESGGGGMVAPCDAQLFRLDGLEGAAGVEQGQVVGAWIDDFGMDHPFQRQLASASAVAAEPGAAVGCRQPAAAR